MTKRKLFTLKQDYQDTLLSTPKTPCKQVYKDMLESSVIVETQPEDNFNKKEKIDFSKNINEKSCIKNKNDFNIFEDELTNIFLIDKTVNKNEDQIEIPDDIFKDKFYKTDITNVKFEENIFHDEIKKDFFYDEDKKNSLNVNNGYAKDFTNYIGDSKNFIKFKDLTNENEDSKNANLTNVNKFENDLTTKNSNLTNVNKFENDMTTKNENFTNVNKFENLSKHISNKNKNLSNVNELTQDPINTTLIGEGDFYKVYLTKNNTALKISKTTVTKNLFNKEIEILKKIETPFCVNYISSFTFSNKFYIELEYCNSGTLRDNINETYFINKSKFPISKINSIMKNILNALKYLKTLNIVHLDIKPENIFIHNDQYKLGDFNISRYEGENVDYDGDKRYMALEVLDGVCTCSSDIYSLGLIYLELLRGINLPCTGDPWRQLRYDEFKGFRVNKVIRMMLRSDYRKRICVEEVLKFF